MKLKTIRLEYIKIFKLKVALLTEVNVNELKPKTSKQDNSAQVCEMMVNNLRIKHTVIAKTMSCPQYIFDIYFPVRAPDSSIDVQIYRRKNENFCADVKEFVNCLNSKFTAIKFTYELEQKSKFSFVIVFVLSLEFEIFRKDGSRLKYLPNNSVHNIKLRV